MWTPHTMLLTLALSAIDVPDLINLVSKHRTGWIWGSNRVQWVAWTRQAKLNTHLEKKNHTQKRGTKTAIIIPWPEMPVGTAFWKGGGKVSNQQTTKILRREMKGRKITTNSNTVLVQSTSNYCVYKLQAYKHKLMKELFLEYVQSDHVYTSGHITVLGPITLALARSIRTHALKVLVLQYRKHLLSNRGKRKRIPYASNSTCYAYSF